MISKAVAIVAGFQDVATMRERTVLKRRLISGALGPIAQFFPYPSQPNGKRTAYAYTSWHSHHLRSGHA